jgi:tRNA threonylcarbamoyladenosine biosynthesis protein TsaE
MKMILNNLEGTTEFGLRVGKVLRGGELIELVGDVGAGKTTLAKAIAKGLGVDENVQSPSFTISNTYEGRCGLTLCHYDFYRLDDAGIMSEALAESAGDDRTVTIVEWADVVKDILLKDRLTMRLKALSENSREMVVQSGGAKSDRLMKGLSQ